MPAGNPSPILFLHVPKTAGTATARFLESAYPGEIFYDYGTERDKQAARSACPHFIRNKASITRHYRFIYGHFHYLKYERMLPDSAVVSLVRDPVERAVSHYYHAARYQDREPLPQAVKVQSGEWDLVDFTLLSGLSRGIYVDYFEGLPIRSFRHILIQEQLRPSLMAMARKLGLGLLESQLAQSPDIPPVNEGAGIPLPSAVRPVTVAARLKLREVLADDFAIYQEVVERFGSSMGS